MARLAIFHPCCAADEQKAFKASLLRTTAANRAAHSNSAGHEMQGNFSGCAARSGGNGLLPLVRAAGKVRIASKPPARPYAGGRVPYDATADVRHRHQGQDRKPYVPNDDRRQDQIWLHSAGGKPACHTSFHKTSAQAWRAWVSYQPGTAACVKRPTTRSVNNRSR